MNANTDFIHLYERGSRDLTILALHGTGGSQSDLVPLAQRLFPGANVLAPLGHVLENGAARFFRRLAEGVFDLENLHRETELLADFVATSSQKYGFDAEKVVALGFSNGANIAASLLLQRPQTLCGAVLLRAMTPFEPVSSPNLKGKPVFLAAGRVDPLVHTENIEKLSRMLRGAGAIVTLEVSEASHGLVPNDIEAAQRFAFQHFAAQHFS